MNKKIILDNKLVIKRDNKKTILIDKNINLIDIFAFNIYNFNRKLSLIIFLILKLVLRTNFIF